MGRPLNSRNFGPGAGKIVITFNDGENVVDGYIVKQTGTRRYQVTADGVNITEVTLAETTAAAENLVEGAATIKAQDSEGNVSYVTTLQSVTALTTSGVAVTWSDDPESDSDFTVPVSPQVGTKMNFAVNPAAMIGGKMFMGTGNYGTNYQIAYDADEGIELGLKIHKRGQNLDYKAEATEGGPLVSVPANTGTGDLGWSVAFSILAGTDGKSSKLSDYDFKMSVQLDPNNAAEPVEMVYDGNGSWKIGSTEIMEIDPGLTSKGADLTTIEQNIMNLGWASLDAFRPEDISADWKTEMGNFSVVLSASKEGAEVLSVSVFISQDGDEPVAPQEPEPDVGGDEEPPVDGGV